MSSTAESKARTLIHSIPCCYIATAVLLSFAAETTSNSEQVVSGDDVRMSTAEAGVRNIHNGLFCVWCKRIRQANRPSG